ncbi:MAG: hypothetical protein EAZ88_01875 [Oscillatoriales cyanobacterium]|nr:MAG: hypothetical protein EAZ88_01875 [Oscillatoriales cyanobacterium]
MTPYSSFVNCQLPKNLTVNCQLSTVNCQLPTVNCQLPTVNCQLSTVNCLITSVRNGRSLRHRLSLASVLQNCTNLLRRELSRD